MPIPNNGLITETNRQYYEGAQGFVGDGVTTTFLTTFNTNLIFGGPDAWDPTDTNYALNNFKLYTSLTAQPGTFEEYVWGYDVVDNAIIFTSAPADDLYIVVQLKKLDGGQYGLDQSEKAYGQTVEDNYGSYGYITLNDIINNFMVAYVGEGKLIQQVKRTDVIFHAKRSLQEFSYDTLRSIKSQELTVPNSLSVILPQDYVNYVKLAWIDHYGVKHPIYPTNNLTTIPYEKPLQDNNGEPLQDNFGSNIEGTSITQRRWDLNNRGIDGLFGDQGWGTMGYGYGYDSWLYYGFFGERYGLDPQYANSNGWFTIDDREGKISFSSNLINKIIVFEYISDGLAYDLDTRVPKLAEEAMYAYIIHAVMSLRVNQPEYIINRLKQEKSAKLRNAKIRLSNIKLEEITQVLRGQSKWIKH
jgi:hypothetical protein